MRPPARAGDVQLVEGARDADARLIGMLVRTSGDQIGHVRDGRGEGFSRLLLPCRHAPSAECAADQGGQRRVRRGRRASPSLDGGLPLLCLSWASRRLSTACSASGSRT